MLDVARQEDCCLGDEWDSIVDGDPGGKLHFYLHSQAPYPWTDMCLIAALMFASASNGLRSCFPSGVLAQVPFKY